MKTKCNLKYVLILLKVTVLCVIFNACKPKVPATLKPIKALFDNGGVWYVDYYEVDGADSTENAFPGAWSNRPNGKMIFLPKESNGYPSPIVSGTSYKALITYYPHTNNLGYLKFFNGESNCNRSSDNTCAINIFIKWCSASVWKINSLTKDKVVLSCEHDILNNVNVNKLYLLTLVK